MLKIYNYIESTKTLGPYNRFALWTQGCPFSCLNCMTPDSQNLNGGVNISVEDIVKIIVNIQGIEGITISGGEPFLQVKALCKVIEKVRETRDFGLIVYTGFTLQQLKEKNETVINTFLNNIDILIDGLYTEELNDGLALRGSSNQNIYQLTHRYSAVFDKHYNQKVREIEVHMQNENAMIVGIPMNTTLNSIII